MTRHDDQTPLRGPDGGHARAAWIRPGAACTNTMWRGRRAHAHQNRTRQREWRCEKTGCEGRWGRSRPTSGTARSTRNEAGAGCSPTAGASEAPAASAARQFPIVCVGLARARPDPPATHGPQARGRAEFEGQAVVRRAAIGAHRRRASRMASARHSSTRSHGRRIRFRTESRPGRAIGGRADGNLGNTQAPRGQRGAPPSPVGPQRPRSCGTRNASIT